MAFASVRQENFGGGIFRSRHAPPGSLYDATDTLFLAWEIKSRPYLVAPAMNATMWDHPATRAAREKLAGYGAKLLPVGDGRLACGEQGEGRLLEVDELEKLVLQSLETKA